MANWQLEGANREWFDLTESDRGVRIPQGGLIGYEDTPVKTLWDEYAFQKGATYRGKRFLPREGTLVLDCYGAGDPWVRGLGEGTHSEVESLVKSAFDYDTPARLHCETDDWGERWLELQKRQEIESETKVDTDTIQYGRLKVPTKSGNPFWQSTPLVYTWTSTTDTTGTGSGPTGHAVETGVLRDKAGRGVRNPTGMPVYGSWRVQAGTSGGVKWNLPDYSLGSDQYGRATEDADRAIWVPALDAGEHAWFDTDPTSKHGPCGTVLNTPLYMRMGMVSFMYRFPARMNPTDIPVKVTNAPAGVSVELTLHQFWQNPRGDI